MRFHRTRFMALAAAGVLSTSLAMAEAPTPTDSPRPDQTSSQQSPAASDHQSSQRQSGQQKNAPEGFILISERVVALTANEPQNHFLRAHALLARGDNRAAAAETRIAAAYLDMQASRDRGGADQALKQAANQLKSVAKEIQKAPAQPGAQNQTETPDKQSTQKDQAAAQTDKAGAQNAQPDQAGSQAIRRGNSPYEQQMTQAFAQANIALAKHFQKLAKGELGRNKTMMTGYDLDAAASSLQAACAWSGQKAGQDVQAAVTEARQAAMRLLVPNMTPDQQQAENNAETRGEAQPAAARITPGDQTQGQPAHTAQQQEKQQAEKALQKLNEAIQSAAGQIGTSAKSDTHDSSSTGSPDRK